MRLPAGSPPMDFWSNIRTLAAIEMWLAEYAAAQQSWASHWQAEGDEPRQNEFEHRVAKVRKLRESIRSFLATFESDALSACNIPDDYIHCLGFLDAKK